LLLKNDIKKDIENIFRTSGSSDELFDTFRASLEVKIKDVELYKTFLSNKALSTDEISMFAEKICKEFPDYAFKIYSWVGQIFTSISFYGKHHDKALAYFKKAASANKASHEPYISIAKMYIKEINTPRFDKIVPLLEYGIETAIKKSEICFALSALYKKTGNKEKEKKYQGLGEKYQKNGF
jgi:hypothetical protein